MPVDLRRGNPAVRRGFLPAQATPAPPPAAAPNRSVERSARRPSGRSTPDRPTAPLTVAGEQAQQARRRQRSRRQVLNEWHRLDVGGLEAPWQDHSRPTNELMPLVLERLKLDQRLAESQILQLWDRVLDPTITAHAKPVGLRRGTLFINVDSNAWLSELVRYRYNDMLEKIQLSVGKDKVERLSLRVG